MFSVILLSGGIGSRTGKNIPKQYCHLLGKEIITYCLDSIKESGLNQELVLVYGQGYKEHLEEILLIYKNSFQNIKLVEGGLTRQESVYNGLLACTGDSVILHESARPFISPEDLKNISSSKFSAVTTGLSIPFTVLTRKGDSISGILKRENLVNIQLPQKFPLKELIDCHIKAKIDGRDFTDDSSLYFTYAGEVGIIEGSPDNIKITNTGDFAIAEELLRSRDGN